jgi:hypothetical protein
MIFFQGKLPEDPTGLELAWSIFFKINCLVSWLVLIRMVVFIFQAKVRCARARARARARALPRADGRLADRCDRVCAGRAPADV